MSIFKNALNTSLGLEDEAPNVQVNIDTDETGMPIDNVTEAGENTPDADEVEIVEEAQEIEADGEVMDEMAEAADSLESIYLAMESAQENGGLTPEAAQFASIAVDNIVSKYNISSEDLGISLESFGDNRAQATTVSMEGVGQALKDLWETIVEKFQAMVKKIVDFYNKTIAAAPRIKRRAESIRKKARATNGTAKESKIKTGLFGQLNVAGAVPTAQQVIKGLQAVTVDITENAKKTEISEAAAKVVGSITDEKNDGIAASDMAGKINSGFTGVAKPSDHWVMRGNNNTSAVKIGGNDPYVVVTYEADLPGNKVLFEGAVGGVNRTSGAAALRDYRYGIFAQDASIKNDKDSRDKEFEVLSTGDVEGICDVVIKAMDAIISQKTQANKKVNNVKVLKKAGEKAIKTMEVADGKDKAKVKSNAREMLTAAVEVTRAQNQGGAQIVSYNYRTSKAALAWCSRSLGQYKKD